MAIEVFNRYENKYIVTDSVVRQLQKRLAQHMELDNYNKQQETYTVTNLYYDTTDNHLIRTSLQKPLYKEKLRLRSYGIPSSNEQVYVEIKKKVAGLVNKRRSALQLNEAYAFLNTAILPDAQPYQNLQVLREIQYMLQMHQLRPALYLAYERIAYFGREQFDVRVSFDRNIRTRRHQLELESGQDGVPLLADDLWLMEIKVAHSIPLWLCDLLAQYQIYPTSFSKYGTEYQKLLETTMNEKPAFHRIPQTICNPHMAVIHLQQERIWKNV